MLAGRPDFDRTSVVAFYDRKPDHLTELIEEVQAEAGNEFGDRFTARPVADVHATLIGLENRLITGGEPDLDGLVRYLRAELRSARLEIQFGGFAAGDRGMLSRGRSLFDRTVAVQGGLLVVLGWPVDGRDGRRLPTMRLARIRHECERYGFRHKYHGDLAPPDPDAYMVLGAVSAATTAEHISFLASVRDSALSGSTRVEVREPDLAVVEYRDLALTRTTSSWWTLDLLG